MRGGLEYNNITNLYFSKFRFFCTKKLKIIKYIDFGFSSNLPPSSILSYFLDIEIF